MLKKIGMLTSKLISAFYNNLKQISQSGFLAEILAKKSQNSHFNCQIQYLQKNIIIAIIKLISHFYTLLKCQIRDGLSTQNILEVNVVKVIIENKCKCVWGFGLSNQLPDIL